VSLPRALAIAFIAAALAGCGVNKYCVNCEKDDGGLHDDGGHVDAAIDGGGPMDGCVPSPEICDGKDNDCDGNVDENTTAEPLPQVGDTCGKNVGVCTTGTIQCVAGALTCSGKNPSAEICDGLDNDCDGVVDNGDPGGGVKCGTDVGDCVTGQTVCTNGAIQCVGSIGPQPEGCDGRDNDCDGTIDEDVPTGASCGPSQGNVGQCKLGAMMCQGGGEVCVGAVFPTFEVCDGLDNDCDGIVDNGFNLQKDPQNCGTCGHVCTIPNGTPACATGKCAVGSCNPGFFDLNKDPSDGCEYACNFQGSQEACNGLDDDCDGKIDEDLTAPALCATLGACAGTMPTCGGATGWKCNYPATVSTDANGNIIPESTCDNIDNDCNGVVDDPFPQKGQACNDGKLGVCQSTGTYACNSAHTGVTCNITKQGGTATSEVCNGKDDDCDGVIDNGANTGNLPGQNWITLASGHQIMAFEASRPDSGNNGAADAGSMTTQPCSKSGVLPWTDVTAPQAQVACQSVGAHLCSEEEWQRACAVVTPTVYPVSEPTTGTGDIFLEAEDAQTIVTGTDAGGTTRAWEPDYTQGFSGMMALRAEPDTGASLTSTTAPAQAPRLDFPVNFTKTGNHTIYVHMYGINPGGTASSGNRVYVGINATAPGTANGTAITTSATNVWQWRPSAQINVATTGTKIVSVYMARDGVKVDAIVVSQSNTLTPTTTTGPGNTYAYDTSPNTYQAATCNGLDSGNGGNVIATGALTSCDANWSGAKAFDLTGNVKEWTLPRVPGVNPIRGGAANDIQGGLACALSFSAADDTFFFPNVGFRCCR
jgi:hypothetical protein